jgi:hypothetical protein
LSRSTDDANAAPDERERESLKDETRTAIEEARMVLPGIQALFGFQLIAVFNAGFERLPATAQALHLAAIGLVTISIALVMAPAAFHRIAQRGWVSRRLIKLTSNFLSCGMGMLMLGLALEVSLVTYVVLRTVLPAILMSLVLLALFLWFWFLFPARNRIGQSHAPSRNRR